MSLLFLFLLLSSVQAMTSDNITDVETLFAASDNSTDMFFIQNITTTLAPKPPRRRFKFRDSKEPTRMFLDAIIKASFDELTRRFRRMLVHK